MNGWQVGLLLYIVFALLTLIPVLRVFVAGTDLYPGGPSFVDSAAFSEGAKDRLDQNFARIRGTLVFWKNQVSRYRAFHTYSVVWITLSTVAVPFLAQAISNPSSKWCVSIIGAYAALLLALSRAFKVEDNYRTFRQGESEVYDLVRRLLDDPLSFGSSEEEQLRRYFSQVASVRRSIRGAETDNFSSIEAATQSSGASPAEE
jgi:hypothetical protein